MVLGHQVAPPRPWAMWAVSPMFILVNKHNGFEVLAMEYAYYRDGPSVVKCTRAVGLTRPPHMNTQLKCQESGNTLHAHYAFSSQDLGSPCGSTCNVEGLGPLTVSVNATHLAEQTNYLRAVGGPRGSFQRLALAAHGRKRASSYPEPASVVCNPAHKSTP